MDMELVLPTLVRWIHIASACAALGAPLFIRIALLPAADKTLQPEQFQALKEAIHARWRHVVSALILLFVLTGLYTFFVTARWKELPKPDRSLYHMLFGIKTLAAFGLFFLASALAGRSKTFLVIRKNAKTWILVVLVLGAVILLCGNLMRQLPRHTTPLDTLNVLTQPVR